MASAPQNPLPLFYNDLIPLNSQQHGGYKSRGTDKAPWMVDVNSVPLTVEEFTQAARHYPIVFTTGDEPLPIGLMGLNEGVNVFFDAEGTMTSPVYLPAYARRYPFMLAKLRPDADELSLCFDPTSDLIGEFDEGVPMFVDGQPSETIQQTLKFCENFEVAGQKTAQFVRDLKKHDLLMDGELNIDVNGDKPFTYRGFQIVDEQKLRDIRGDLLRTWNQNGLLPLVYAHLFSLQTTSDIFNRQVQLGKGPQIPQKA